MFIHGSECEDALGKNPVSGDCCRLSLTAKPSESATVTDVTSHIWDFHSHRSPLNRRCRQQAYRPRNRFRVDPNATPHGFRIPWKANMEQENPHRQKHATGVVHSCEHKTQKQHEASAQTTLGNNTEAMDERNTRATTAGMTLENTKHSPTSFPCET